MNPSDRPEGARRRGKEPAWQGLAGESEEVGTRGGDGPGDGGGERGWHRLYAVVVVYGVLMILALAILTRMLDPGTP